MDTRRVPGEGLWKRPAERLHRGCKSQGKIRRLRAGRGFETVDTTENGYALLALSFDGTKPHFTENAKTMRIDEQGLVVYYDPQCPYAAQSIAQIETYCKDNGVPVEFRLVDTLEKAKALPCVFNNWAVFYRGAFQTVNLLDTAALKRILK